MDAGFYKRVVYLRAHDNITTKSKTQFQTLLFVVNLQQEQEVMMILIY